jgi:hypothetical protein
LYEAEAEAGGLGVGRVRRREEDQRVVWWWEMSSVTRSRFGGEGVKRGFGRLAGFLCVFCMRQRWIAGGKLALGTTRGR